MPRWSRWLLPTVTGLLLGLSYPPFTIPLLVWVAPIPLLLFCWGTQSKREAFLGGIIAGLLFFSILFEWILATYPLEWAGLSPGIATASIVVGLWLASSLFLALFTGLFSVGASRILHQSRNFLLSSLSVAGLWAVCEYAWAWGFGLLWWDSGAPLGPHWTFGWLAHALAETPFVHLARLGGSLILSFLIILVATLVALFIITPRRKGVLIAIAAVLSASLAGSLTLLYSPLTPTGSLSVVLVQNNVPPETRSNADQLGRQIEQQLALLGSLAVSLPSNPDLIVLPEGRGISWGDPAASQTKKFLVTLWGNNHPTLIESVQFKDEENRFFSQLLITDASRPRPDIVYRKQLLIPGGETMPFILRKTLQIFGKSDLLQRFNEGRTLTRDNHNLRAASSGAARYGALICSGVISPSYNRLLARDGAGILIVSSSYSVFSDDNHIVAQSRAAAILKAVENHRYFLQSANGGRSLIIAPSGEVKNQAPTASNGTLRGTVDTISEKTTATRLGDWVLLFFVALALAGYWRKR